MDALGQPVNTRQATIRVNAHWDNYIDQLFIRLASDEVCQVELQAQQKLSSAMASMHPTTTIKTVTVKPLKAQRDVPVMAFKGASGTTDDSSRCWSCNSTRHRWGAKCPAVKALCGLCDRKGRLTKNRQTRAENPKQGKRSKVDKSTDEDEIEDGTYMTWTFFFAV